MRRIFFFFLQRPAVTAFPIGRVDLQFEESVGKPSIVTELCLPSGPSKTSDEKSRNEKQKVFSVMLADRDHR